MTDFVDPFDNPDFVKRFEENRQRADSVNATVDDPIMRKYARSTIGKNVLEIGCATGHFTEILCEYADKLSVIDKSPAMMSECQSRISRKNVNFFCTDFLNFNENCRYDFIFAGMFLHLVAEPSDFFRKCRLLLKDGGQLIVSSRHPLRTANPAGGKESIYNDSWEVRHYLVPAARELEWLGERVRQFHHPVSLIVNDAISAKFTVMRMDEPTPDLPANFSKKVAENSSVPSVLILDLKAT